MITLLAFGNYCVQSGNRSVCQLAGKGELASLRRVINGEACRFSFMKFVSFYSICVIGAGLDSAFNFENTYIVIVVFVPTKF